ncbi:class I SAM-dependent methyltransferase [Maribellus maritimus]|uniref:class I SAM-dependent methyltransferase n=1 Tax=Maribellus maritimus TaxID=2870838 RepID=UPI001EEB8424|nr:class I SAM-dependent methyltransferase [Maribellus maritimus]MCG6186482.1 class I SAM-dependent methyltransferase [Maribellus maritimus]
MVESGGFYSVFVDPVLVKMREKVAAHIEPRQKIIDVACGTGAQVFELAKNAEFVMGVDLSSSMIKKATQTKNKQGFENTGFKVCDATQLVHFKEKEFDVATMSLALHQFSPLLYSSILGEMKRISAKIVIVDYSVPLPKNIVGCGSRWAEFMAGREHHRNFRKFYKNGGLENVLRKNGLAINKSVYFARDTFQLVVALANGKEKDGKIG